MQKKNQFSAKSGKPSYNPPAQRRNEIADPALDLSNGVVSPATQLNDRIPPVHQRYGVVAPAEDNHVDVLQPENRDNAHAQPQNGINPQDPMQKEIVVFDCLCLTVKSWI
ncbi:hypothetical protein GCK72_015502 [Caenorhabditis remanei]|uniref:Uncharacterized protein n=1 Tax=Caenorhabditis remanei TaxID=31234 RepID=A0A6A5GXF2_CAERE|nr:hypothetical protein GCK72_015502 [Caenorhabditis remanei]KAF1759042.1 hypothetical protein GCK72_015502 [Caenorhabditis remanei]